MYIHAHLILLSLMLTTQSNKQKTLFRIKHYVINTLSTVQWTTQAHTHIYILNTVNTYMYTYTVKYNTHTSIVQAAILAQIQSFISSTHTFTPVDNSSSPTLPSFFSWQSVSSSWNVHCTRSSRCTAPNLNFFS